LHSMQRSASQINFIRAMMSPFAATRCTQPDQHPLGAAIYTQ
jgi:hypothetical protein